jgi:hypothetical protein
MPTERTRDALASALRDALISPNVSDRNLEPANVVDVLKMIADALSGLAFGDAGSVSPATNLGEFIGEAAETIAGGLHNVADAIREASAAKPQ